MGRLVDYLVRTDYFAEKPLVAVDVGVRGGFEKKWHAFGNQVQLVGIEANADACVGVRKTWPGSIVVHGALAKEAGTREFYLASHPNASSLYLPNANADRFPFGSSLSPRGKQHIDVRTLDSVMDELGLVPDYIKMDCEGAEGEILRGAPHCLSHTLTVYTESLFWPIRQGQSVFRDVDKILADASFFLAYLKGYRHFRKTLSANPFPENRGQMLWADTLYFRDVFGEYEWNKRSFVALAALMDLERIPDCAIEVIQVGQRAGAISEPDAGKLVNLLTPLVDGRVVSYEEYWALQREAIGGAQAASHIARAYKANWHGRI